MALNTITTLTLIVVNTLLSKMFIYSMKLEFSFSFFCSSPCQRQCELLPWLGIRRPSSGRKYLWKVLYKDCLFHLDPLTNMAATGNYCFWLADFWKSSPKPLGQMNRNLVGSIYGRSSVKIANFIPIHLQTWPPQPILVSDWPIFKNLLLRNRLTKWTEIW